MQVIIFDKYYHCIYRLRKVPKDWHFDKIAEMLNLKYSALEYQAFYMEDNAQLCIDDFVFKNDELMLTDSSCND